MEKFRDNDIMNDDQDYNITNDSHDEMGNDKRNNSGFLRVAAVSPVLKVANTVYNTDEIIRCAKKAVENGAAAVIFPELAITSSTCGDLFFQQSLYAANLEGLRRIVEASNHLDAVLVVGTYVRVANSYYDCAAVIQCGNIMGIVPKMFMPGGHDAYDDRWFAPGVRASSDIYTVKLFGEEVPFGNIIFTAEGQDSVSFGISVGTDILMPISPAACLSLNGAQLIFIPAADGASVGKAESRVDRIIDATSIDKTGIVYAAAGVFESTTDQAYDGHCIIAESGVILAESERFGRESAIIYSEIDIERLTFERSIGHAAEDCAYAYTNRNVYTEVEMAALPFVDMTQEKLLRRYERNPFIPGEKIDASGTIYEENKAEIDRRCEEIFNIQAAALAKRVEHAHAKSLVIGISGGLDSTLAFLVAIETFRKLGRDTKNVIAVTMPGFGTTDQTHSNALSIMELLGADVREVSIADAVAAHFEDIGHDPDIHDVTYENSQARERTQILMDIANDEGGMVVGTGDMSEAALGWCTYNGDHMSMYGVNISIPKTLVRRVVRWIADCKAAGPSSDPSYSLDNAALHAALHDIIDTPISPELLPPDKDGKMVQKTEDRVGPYILHDFFLYHTIRFGMKPARLLYIAEQTFEGEFENDAEKNRTYIKKWLREFYRRFFTQQYKRSCTPDGPKVGTVDLSPRGDWRMPSDADASIWLAELD